MLSQSVFALILIIGLFFASGRKIVAQPESSSHALQGKRVGLYISLRNFHFSDVYNQLLAGYIKQADSLDLYEETFRRAVVIRAGNQLVYHLNKDIKTTQAIYLNSVSDVAQDFVSNEKYKGIPYEKLASLNLDYVLIWDEARLEAEFRPVVRTYSNQVFTVQQRIDKILMRWRVVDVQKRRILNQLTVHYESDKPSELPTYLPPSSTETSAERLFRRAWNAALALIEMSWP